MNRLAELQASFQQCLLEPPLDRNQPWIRAGGRATPDRHLSAYIHAYPARLKEVLANDYPALRTAIGDEAFDDLAQAYINVHPSHYFSLRDFGALFADFIGGQHAGSEHPWLVELAAFEWTLGKAFDASDTPVARIDDMAAFDPSAWPGLHFDMHPSVQRLELAWNTVNLWASLTADEPSFVTPTVDAATPWLIWREQLTTRFRSLEPDEDAALGCLFDGRDFGEVCEQLAIFVDLDDVPLHAATMLKGWLDQGLISCIHLE